MDYSNLTYSAIICCGGESTRFKGKNKLLVDINGAFIFEYAIRPFIQDKRCNQVILVIPKIWHSGVILDAMKKGKVSWTHGGETRTESTRIGLLGVHNKYVFVHDGCRPLVSSSLIDKLLKTYLEKESKEIGIVPYKRVHDLVIDQNNKPLKNPRIIMTPQFYETNSLKKVFNRAKEGESYRDTSSLCIDNKENVLYSEYDTKNIKLTTQEDLEEIKKEILRN